MTKLHGRFTRLYMDGYDISGDSSSFEPGLTGDTAEVTAFGDDTKKYVVGLIDSAVRFSGFFNDSVNRAHAVVSPRVGSDTIIAATWGTTPGQAGVGGSMRLSEYT